MNEATIQSITASFCAR